jgi:hypothetical protein
MSVVLLLQAITTAVADTQGSVAIDGATLLDLREPFLNVLPASY